MARTTESAKNSEGALTWRLPLRTNSPLAGLAEQATALGVPLHLTQLAPRRHPLAATPGAVLVAENPPRTCSARDRPSSIAYSHGMRVTALPQYEPAETERQRPDRTARSTACQPSGSSR